MLWGWGRRQSNFWPVSPFSIHLFVLFCCFYVMFFISYCWMSIKWDCFFVVSNNHGTLSHSLSHCRHLHIARGTNWESILLLSRVLDLHSFNRNNLDATQKGTYNKRALQFRFAELVILWHLMTQKLSCIFVKIEWFFVAVSCVPDHDLYNDGRRVLSDTLVMRRN